MKISFDDYRSNSKTERRDDNTRIKLHELIFD